MSETASILDLPPRWRIRPEGWTSEVELEQESLLLMAPGEGFGLGSHETTQVCLLALGHLLRAQPTPRSVLDFGSGSGILGIAAAKRVGARVEAVDLDEAANQHARRNAELNGVSELIEIRTTLSEPAHAFDLVLANILCPVLLDFAAPLCARQDREGHMVLSGILATDVPAIVTRYSRLLGGMRPEVYGRGEWRAVVYSRT